MFEDDEYFFPVSGRGSRVETLPEGENLSMNIDDLMYFTNRRYEQCRIPDSYIKDTTDMNISTTVDIQDYNFTTVGSYSSTTVVGGGSIAPISTSGITIDPALAPSASSSVVWTNGNWMPTTTPTASTVQPLTTTQIGSLSGTYSIAGISNPSSTVILTESATKAEEPEKIDYLGAVHAVVGHK